MAKLTRSGNICLLSSIFLVSIQFCVASSFAPREYEDGLDRNNVLEELRERSRLGDNTLDDLQPEETDADRWSRARGFSRNSGTVSLDDVLMKVPTRENENYNSGDERKEYFKASVRGYNPQSIFRQKENPNSRATLLLNGLRKKSVKNYATYPQYKRQILYRQCFFNPISCF